MLWTAALPPAGPFLTGQKGAKEPVRAGDSDFPRPDTPPLKTAKERGCGPPLWILPRGVASLQKPFDKPVPFHMNATRYDLCSAYQILPFLWTEERHN